MKRLLTAFILFGSLTLGYTQGSQGHVTLSGSVRIAATGHAVVLTWQSSKNAATYSVYRAAVHGGPYTKIASGIANTTYCDSRVTHNQTLYYVATGVSGSNESGYSNEAVVAIP
jgi:fibronectin type 3 domain-containing protein